MEAQARKQDNPFLAAHEAFDALERDLTEGPSMEMTHSELEEFVDGKGRELLRQLVQGHFTLRGLREVREPVVGADDIERNHVRRRKRGVGTIFGHVELEREGFGQRNVDSLFPVDAELNLPEESYSLGLRQRVALEAAKVSFDEVVAGIEKSTGVAIPKRQVEELALRASENFDEFYEQRELAANAGSGEILVITTDGKGVSMRREGLRPATRKAAEKRRPKRKKRRSKGEKSMTRRMAQVAAVYTIAPYVRTPEDIVGELGRDPNKPALRPADADEPARSPRPRPECKRVWASVSHEASVVVEQAFAEASRRDPTRSKTAVALVDGNEHQLASVMASALEAGISIVIIIDIIHVIEYLWGAANALFGEGTTDGEEWVTERLYRILCGKSSDVAAGMRRSATLKDLTEAQREPIDRCANYLLKLREYLRYDEYLAAGYPIATGVIEGACRYLVKDRMDITGARWSLQGAEAVLRLRALRASGDFEEYWAFHVAKHQERIHRQLYAANTIPKTQDPPRSRRKTPLRVVR